MSPSSAAVAVLPTSAEQQPPRAKFLQDLSYDSDASLFRCARIGNFDAHPSDTGLSTVSFGSCQLLIRQLPSKTDTIPGAELVCPILKRWIKENSYGPE